MVVVMVEIRRSVEIRRERQGIRSTSTSTTRSTTSSSPTTTTTRTTRTHHTTSHHGSPADDFSAQIEFLGHPVVVRHDMGPRLRVVCGHGAAVVPGVIGPPDVDADADPLGPHRGGNDGRVG